MEDEGWGEEVLREMYDYLWFIALSFNHRVQRLRMGCNQLIWIGRHEPLVFDFALHDHAASSLLQDVPDFQERPHAVFAPLTVPKPQFLDSLSGQKLLPFQIVLHVFRQPVLKSVEFHREPGGGTIKIQVVSAAGMLAAEFESSETTGPQGRPQGFFLGCLVMAQAAGAGVWASLRAPPLPVPLPHFSKWRRGGHGVPVVNGGSK